MDGSSWEAGWLAILELLSGVEAILELLSGVEICQPAWLEKFIEAQQLLINLATHGDLAKEDLPSKP